MSATRIWASTSSGSLRRGRAGGRQVGVRGALQELDLGEPDPGLLVGRALAQRLLVGGDAVVVVAGVDGVVRRLVQRRQRLLDRLASATSAAPFSVGSPTGTTPATPFAAATRSSSVRTARTCASGCAPWNSGIGWPLSDREDRRDRLDLEGLRELRVRVDVDGGEQEPAAELGGEALEHGRQLLARLAPVGPEVDDDRHGRRAVDDLGHEGRVGDRDDRSPGRRTRPAARLHRRTRRPAVAGGFARRARAERSTAPRRSSAGRGARPGWLLMSSP